MKSTKKKIGICVIIPIVVGVFVAFILFRYNDNEGQDYYNYLIALESFVVSLIALIYAMTTYYSIDTLNGVTAMEGNVLEDRDYTVAYTELINEYSDCKNQSDFQKALMQNVFPDEASKTCMEFADNIQKIIDHLLLFAYVDYNDKDFEEHCQRLIDVVRNAKEKYASMSNGIQYLFNENVKLIEYIMKYQKMRKTKQGISRLEDVRGKMLDNPISRILYYDYLGLDYRVKAKNIINNKFQDNQKEFSKERMEAVLNSRYDLEELSRIDLLLNRSKECFENALVYADGELLWEGYIRYNLVRVEIMKEEIKYSSGNGEFDRERLLSEIEKVIECRKNVHYFFFNEQPDNYLKSEFKREISRAEELKMAVSGLNV